MSLDRRSFLVHAGAGVLAASAGVAVACAPTGAAATAAAGGPTLRRAGMSYPYRLPDLPYAHDALEPHIDARTMEIHHRRHHQAYVDNLNGALEDHPQLQDRDLAELLRDLDALPAAIRTTVRNNGGGHLNHAQFWRMMAPDGGGAPGGELAAAIDRAFGSQDAFRSRFREAALGVFGSGWAWLASDGAGTLRIVQTPNQDTPVMQGLRPLLGIDVWEHAYYLHYQNRRAEYVDAWWNVVDWTHVAQRYADRAAA